MMKEDVGLDDVIKALRRIEKGDARANEAYRAMLERHPKHPKLLQVRREHLWVESHVQLRKFALCRPHPRLPFSAMQGTLLCSVEETSQGTATRVSHDGARACLQMYARFLEEVQCNITLAHQFYMDAEKVEDAAAARGEEEENAEGGERKHLSTIDESRDGVVVVNTEGIISFSNAHICRLFGYKRGDLIGRNVSQLMPQPYSQQHDRYIQNFVRSGIPRVLNRVRTVVALHHDRTVFPVTICVTKISQASVLAAMRADALFLVWWSMRQARYRGHACRMEATLSWE